MADSKYFLTFSIMELIFELAVDNFETLAVNFGNIQHAVDHFFHTIVAICKAFRECFQFGVLFGHLL